MLASCWMSNSVTRQSLDFYGVDREEPANQEEVLHLSAWARIEKADLASALSLRHMRHRDHDPGGRLTGPVKRIFPGRFNKF